MGFSQFLIGLGNIIAPILTETLLSDYGFRGTVTFLAAFTLHSVPASALYQPISRHMKKVKKTEQAKSLVGNEDRATDAESLSMTSTNSQYFMKRRESDKYIHYGSQTIFDSSLYIAANNQARLSTTPQPPKRSFCSKINDIFGLQLLKDLQFVSVILGLCTSFMAEVNFLTLLPMFMTSLGFDKSQSAVGLTVFTGSDVISRMVFPFITTKFHLTNRTVFNIGVLGAAITRCSKYLYTKQLCIRKNGNLVF